MGYYIRQGSLEVILTPYSTLYTHTHTHIHIGWCSDVMIIMITFKHIMQK